jgi:hypothetical protein
MDGKGKDRHVAQRTRMVAWWRGGAKGGWRWRCEKERGENIFSHQCHGRVDKGDTGAGDCSNVVATVPAVGTVSGRDGMPSARSAQENRVETALRWHADDGIRPVGRAKYAAEWYC